MADNFRYDEKEHIYYNGDKRLPSVTEIVGNVCGGLQYAEEWHLHRGSMVHKAIQLYLQEKLNEASIDPRIRSCVESAKRAIKELSIQPVLIEFPMYHKILWYAGTPDLLTDKGILIDWKSSKMKESIIQAGGYVALLENNGYLVKKCYEIILENDRYIVNEFKPARSKGLFFAALSIYGWRRKNGTGN